MDGDNFLTCTSPHHRLNVSIYPKSRVPKSHFLNKTTRAYYKSCCDCRKHVRDYEKARVIPTTVCVCCKNRPRIDKQTRCQRCFTKQGLENENAKKAFKQVQRERVLELGCCCEVCRKSFIKKTDGSHGFITVDSMEGIDIESIELRNLDFDHLPKKEQLARGLYYGKKKRGVASMGSYTATKRESKKCQLVCLACHPKESQRRFLEARFAEPRVRKSKEYVDACKLHAGKCSLCGCFDKSNLEYYEWDHIDPASKLEKISHMVATNKTIPRIATELKKCRLLCTFCHRIHSWNQRKRANLIKKQNKGHLFAILHDMIYNNIYYPFEVFTKKKIPL